MPIGIYKRTKPSWNKDKKGLQIAWNKGTKGIVKPNKGSIQKGMTGDKAISWKGGKLPCIDCGGKTSKRLIKRCRKCSDVFHVRENTNNWRGGISKNPYPLEFNRVLRLKIRTRDSFTCCLCGRTEREELEELNRVLCVNHIDFDKNNCQENNLNTLCSRCNTKINRERDYWTDYFNQK